MTKLTDEELVKQLRRDYAPEWNYRDNGDPRVLQLAYAVERLMKERYTYLRDSEEQAKSEIRLADSLGTAQVQLTAIIKERDALQRRVEALRKVIEEASVYDGPLQFIHYGLIDALVADDLAAKSQGKEHDNG